MDGIACEDQPHKILIPGNFRRACVELCGIIKMQVINSKRPIEDGAEEFAKKARLSPSERAAKVVQESQVGITAYINDANGHHGGFTGQIKMLYSDFQVNEIDLNGNVVHLLDDGIDMGKSKKERRLEKREEERRELEGKSAEEIEAINAAKKQAEEQAPKYTLSDEHRTELLTLLSEKELAEIEELFTSGNKMETQKSFDDKQVRGRLHQLIRAAFQGKLETVTSAENTFHIAIAKNQNKTRQNIHESMNHTDDNGVVNYGLGMYKPYLHLTVFKENRESMEIGNTLAKFLRFPNRAIGFAGTKDRRGATCQRFSIHRGKLTRVNGLNKAINGAVLGGFSYEDKPLNLGDLKGNEFSIVIRDVKSVNESDDIKSVVDQCFGSLRDKGFLNYYGMQRFGSFSISTHKLGVFVLNEDYQGACELILSEQEVTAPDSIEGRRIWAETKDASLALQSMPRRFAAEHLILTVLSKTKDGEPNKGAWYEAMMSIPKNLRIMYGHAYQSYIWNLVALKRHALFGLEVQVGDLVMEELPRSAIPVDEDFPEDVAEYNDTLVKVLTQEDIDSGKFTIYDVVLPSPGFKITYPANPDLYQVYVEEMAKDGLHPEKMLRKVKEFSFPGSYRKVMGKAANLSYEMISYSDDKSPIYRTDLEMLTLKKEGKEPEQRIIDQGVGEKTAVVLKMQLGLGAYATMALREFMKADTSRFGTTMVGK